MPNVINRVGGGGGTYPSVFFTSDDFTSQGSVTMTGEGRTYNGVWGTKQVPNPAYRNLPSGYTQVEYIESHGNEYIDTGVIGNIGVGLKTKVAFLGEGILCGCYTRIVSGTPYYYICRLRYSSLLYGYRDNEVTDFYTPTIGDIYQIESQLYSTGSKFYVNGSLVDSRSSVSATNSTISLYLLASHDTDEVGSVYAKISAKLYFAELYENDGSTLSRDYVTCKRDSDSVYGLYDKVNNTFTTTPTGAFTGGEVVPKYLTTQGFLISNIKSFGTYSYTATQGTKTKTGSVLIDTVEDIDVNVGLFSKVYLYNEGIEEVTLYYQNQTYATITKNNSNITITPSRRDTSCIAIRTNSSINTSNYSRLCVEYTMSTRYDTDFDIGIGYSPNAFSAGLETASTLTDYSFLELGSSRHTTSVNLISDNYYLGLSGHGGVVIYKIWLE